MKVKAITGVIAGGKHVNAGTIYEGGEGECSLLLASGRCVRIDAPEPETVEETVKIKDADGEEQAIKTEYTTPAGKKVGARKLKKEGKVR